ncbi:MAG: superoxide dismutase [Crocinitomicaceae bacterium]|nr:superoxide dismutase [Crocinitomicaceae bacterium]
MKYISILIASLAIVLSHEVNAQAPYVLKKLNYEYNALAPYIDAQTMEIHHSKHHQGYVNNLNEALKENKDFAALKLEELLLLGEKLPVAIRNNGGGVYNHNLFFDILSPKLNTEPSKSLQASIDADFKGMKELKAQMNKAAASRFGSGWAWLVLTPGGKLVVTSTPNQDNPIMLGSEVRGIPIMGIDVWEHAYYLKYQNKRGEYLDSIWSVLDWNVISAKFEEAKQNPVLKKIAQETIKSKPF